MGEINYSKNSTNELKSQPIEVELKPIGHTILWGKDAHKITPEMLEKAKWKPIPEEDQRKIAEKLRQLGEFRPRPLG